ncbi:hypothetical protein BRARA_I02536 [Brassica rapa]|uniref:SWIM-type domain-containing protein n=1 Tax=Brassica campestris TaxID=3711 RepID=A0A397XWV1_BRACM|nr:hypothetical protein BRARA_I02536 [Brassica rapa]
MVVLHGQPMDVEELHRAFPNFRPPNTGPHGVPQEVQPLRTLPPYQPIWEEESEEEQAYWNGVFEAEQNHQVNVSPAPRPANGALGLPIGPNLRVSGPTTPNTVMVVDEDDASYTGSSDGLIASQNNSGLTPAIPVAENLMNNTVGVAQAAAPAPTENGNTARISQVSNGGTRTAIPTNGGPSLDLTLAIGVNNNHGTEAIIEINDSDSEADGESGNINSEVDDLYEGMVFRNKAHFKHHIALYALHKKFRLRNTRSSPEGIVMRCISGTCMWRVYATKIKNVDKYEIRKASLQHTCSVDDRVGYERQATHAVIGEVMRSRYVGNGGAPRPNEIMQVMLGDHDVKISYWKAWRSREVALEYSQGSSGASYKLLPDYLQRLVVANPGTISQLETQFQAGVGHRFKYLFLALGASVRGFEQMRNVIIVDGTHLRGKYGGCLLTASAQDGNYQVFPLALAVVDSENDKAWEWFFKMLLQFIPNEEGVVFVSDRHASICNAISKVYPEAQHCACILHLKRNIRTYFKDKHLSYLVGKAARAFLLPEFYGIFNEIKMINAACAEYLIDIGFEHWARVHFSGNRYNIMTSNIAESWNSVLREAREYPILPMLEFIRSKLTSWFSERRSGNNNDQNRLSKRVHEIVEANFEQCGGMVACKINSLEYEVRNKEGGSFHVNLGNKSCSCNVFQALMIPCSHAIAASIKAKVKVESLVSEVYSVECLGNAYKVDIFPVSKINPAEDEQTEAVSLEVLPPATRRPPGRPHMHSLQRSQHENFVAY